MSRPRFQLGGGKSCTYGNIITPVVDHVTANFDINVALEQYTMEGIQRHQEDNKGYGLIVGDEGHRLLSAINAKQTCMGAKGTRPSQATHIV